MESYKGPITILRLHKYRDEVLLNTTAVELSLGTGGYHFVIANLNNLESNFTKGDI